MVVAPSQGPPGTGKTTAILGIASVLLSPKGELSTGAKTALPDAHKPPEPKRYKQSSAAKRWQQEHQKELEEAAEKEAKDPWISSTLKARPDRRVLICAQSNAAVDELVRFVQHAMSRISTSFHFKICQFFALAPPHGVICFRVHLNASTSAPRMQCISRPSMLTPTLLRCSACYVTGFGAPTVPSGCRRS